MKSNKKLRKTPLAIALGGLLAASQLSAAAEFTLEEVVVTAQKRAQGLQDVPISLNAMQGDKMESAGIEEMEDLAAYIPSFTVASGTLSNFVYIRGIGSTQNAGFEQSVATYVDGIYYGRSIQSRAPFMDLERVEVLRGPQSIIFGKNAIAGAVNVVTAKPTDEFEGDVGVFYGPEDNEKELNLVLSGPLTDSLSGRLAIRDYETDGFLKNITTGNDDPGADEQTIRASLKFDLSEDTEILAMYEHSSFDSNARTFQITDGGGHAVFDGLKFDKERATDQTLSGDPVIDDPEDQEIEMDTFALTINHDIGDYTLTTITGYSAYEMEEGFDADISVVPIFEQVHQEDFTQYSQEVRLLSPTGGDFEYITGFYYQKTDLVYDEEVATNLENAFGPGAPLANKTTDFDTDSETWSAFVQGSWQVSDAARITGGLRYSKETKDATHRHFYNEYGGTERITDPAIIGFFAGALQSFEHDFEADRKEEHLSWSLTGEYDFSSDAMFYATASTGFKGGGYDARGVGQTPELWEFEEEQALNIEAGVKLTLGDGVATLNMAVFNTEYEDLQTSQFDGFTAFIVTNAAEATVRGLEIDGRWQLNQYVTLFASAAYLDFAYDNFDTANCTVGQQALLPTVEEQVSCTQDLSGETTLFAPDVSASAGLDFSKEIFNGIELIGALDVIYSDEYYLAQDLDENQVQDSFTKFNGSIGLAAVDGEWEIRLVGKNLTDELTATVGNDVALRPGAFFQTTDRTRSWGVNAKYRF